MLKPTRVTSIVEKLERQYGSIDDIPDDEPGLKKIQKITAQQQKNESREQLLTINNRNDYDTFYSTGKTKNLDLYKVAKLVQKHIPYSKISQILGISPNSVWNYVRNHGLRYKVYYMFINGVRINGKSIHNLYKNADINITFKKFADRFYDGKQYQSGIQYMFKKVIYVGSKLQNI